MEHIQLMEQLKQLIIRYPSLEAVKEDIRKAFEVIAESFTCGGKLLIAGNGGSAADADHLVAELMKNFVIKRNLPAGFTEKIRKINNDAADYLLPRLQPGFPAINLSNHSSLNTAIINDIDGNITFSQQVYAYGKAGDVFLGITTTGNSKNILYAAATAKAKDLKVIALTGRDGGQLKSLSDVAIIVPENETYKIQELHLPVYHCLALMIEEYFFK